MATEQTYRVGIIGFGFIGKVHAFGHLNLPFYYDNPPRTRITHVCARHAESAEAGRALLSAETAVTDFRRITENPAIDIVHICSPNDAHKEALLSAMAHQKHIYCDKPLVVDAAEAAEIARALPGYRGTAQMTFQARFSPGVLRAKQLIDEGRLGSVLQFRAAFLHAGSADPRAPLKWKLSAEAGGGVIADLGSHVLDLTHFLLGDYRRLVCTTSIAYPRRSLPDGSGQTAPVTAEDSALMLVEMANGATGTLEATKLATGSEDELRFEIHGSNGALRYNQMRPHYLEFFDAAAPDRPLGGTRGWTEIAVGQRYPEPANGFPTAKTAVGWMRGHIACLANFLYDVQSGAPGNPGLRQGILIQNLMDACRASARNLRWVDV